MNMSSPASLVYSPVESCMNFCASRLRASRSLMQATMFTASSISKQGWIQRRIAASLPVVSAPLCLISATQGEQFLQQIAVVHARRLRGLREIFLGREVGVGIGLDDVDLPVTVQPV